jgi:hypothetical protein
MHLAGAKGVAFAADSGGLTKGVSPRTLNGIGAANLGEADSGTMWGESVR